MALAGDWGSREAHLFTIETESDKLSPNLEINIPYSHNANVGGVIIKDGNRWALAHRGIINAFRGRIPKDVTMNYFKDKVITVEKNSNIIFIAYFDSEDFIDEVASFISSVLDFKAQYKKENS